MRGLFGRDGVPRGKQRVIDAFPGGLHADDGCRHRVQTAAVLRQRRLQAVLVVPQEQREHFLFFHSIPSL